MVKQVEEKTPVGNWLTQVHLENDIGCI